MVRKINRGLKGVARRRGRFGKRRIRKPVKRPIGSADLGFDENAVLRLLGLENRPIELGEIMDVLDFTRRKRKMLLAGLADLCRRDLVECTAAGLYRLYPSPALITGIIAMNPRGFGFVTPKEFAAEGRQAGRDLYISPRNLATAIHGDLVLVQALSKKGDRREGRVISVLSRAANRLVGVYSRISRHSGRVVPDDDRYPFIVMVTGKDSNHAKNGDAVVVEFTAMASDANQPVGRIIEVLGDSKDLTVQTEMTIRSHGLPYRFSPEVEDEVARLEGKISLQSGRVDLRDVPHVTIDGETARDFDDAVAVKSRSGGYRLYVSIADVAHYVQPGTALDSEARKRGTSVYFPNKVVPMLPERLSNDLCSLVPGQDRLAFTAILDFDDQGNRLGQKFQKSIIRSRHRLTYTNVKQVLVDEDGDPAVEFAEIVPDLIKMAELAAKLWDRRLSRGSIGFEIPEAAIEIGETGQVLALNRLERNVAHRLIEEFMLAANEAVAETLAKKRTPALFRIHEEPDAAKVEMFCEFASSLGIRLPRGDRNPAWFGKVLGLTAGTPKEYLISNLLLRSMQQARYAPGNVGHFGLAAPYYTHFTSPIRRYPDLLVHRALLRVLTLKKESKRREAKSTDRDLVETGQFLSDRERAAERAEREVREKMKVRFMSERIGEVFDGIISGVTSFGLFVELLETSISGGVAMTDLTDDYYSLDDKNHRLVGRLSNRVLQLGDLVRVKVASVEVQRRRINFTLE